MVSPRAVRIPLEAYRPPHVHFTLVRAVFTLFVRAANGDLWPMRFVLDTASAVTLIPVANAREAGLSIPYRPVEFTIQTASGESRQRRRPGRIQGEVPGLEGLVFDWPCHFVEQQDLVLNVLGLAGVLDDLRITLDGRYSLEAPHGWLILERQPVPETAAEG
jgi:hypothetical protein